MSSMNNFYSVYLERSTELLEQLTEDWWYPTGDPRKLSAEAVSWISDEINSCNSMMTNILENNQATECSECDDDVIFELEDVDYQEQSD